MSRAVTLVRMRSPAVIDNWPVPTAPAPESEVLTGGAEAATAHTARTTDDPADHHHPIQESMA